MRHIRSSDDGALAPRLLGAAGLAAPHRPARRTAVCARAPEDEELDACFSPERRFDERERRERPPRRYDKMK